MQQFLLLLKPVAVKIGTALVMRKAEKEMIKHVKTIANENEEIIEVVEKLEVAVVSKKKVSAWASVAIAISYYLSSTGTITPELAALIDSLLTNVGVLELLESAVE